MSGRRQSAGSRARRTVDAGSNAWHSARGWQVHTGAALAAAVGIRRHEGERVDSRRRNGPRDDLRGQCGQSAQSSFLPGRDEGSDVALVDESGFGGRERQPPARALTAAGNGPDRRGAAALAERRHDRRQGVSATLAEQRAGPPTREAALREEEIEQNPTLAGQLCRHCDDCAAKVASRSHPW